MKRAKLWTPIMAGLAVVAIACTATSVLPSGVLPGGDAATLPPPAEQPPTEPPPPPTTPPLPTDPPPPSGPPSFTVVNDSDGTICYLYISPVTIDVWGDDVLGEEVLAAGSSQTFDLDEANIYDIKAEDCDRHIIHSSLGLDVQGPLTWTVTFSPGPPVPVTVVNNSGAAVCFVQISPNGAENWGADWLGEEETIAVGGSRVIDVGSGLYDMRALDCERGPLGEQTAIDLSGPYTWNVP